MDIENLLRKLLFGSCSAPLVYVTCDYRIGWKMISLNQKCKTRPDPIIIIFMPRWHSEMSVNDLPPWGIHCLSIGFESPSCPPPFPKASQGTTLCHASSLGKVWGSAQITCMVYGYGRIELFGVCYVITHGTLWMDLKSKGKKHLWGDSSPSHSFVRYLYRSLSVNGAHLMPENTQRAGIPARHSPNTQHYLSVFSQKNLWKSIST